MRGLIYFLEAQRNWLLVSGVETGVGLVKIGTTIRLADRLKQVAAEIGHEPKALGVMDGDRSEEQAIHRRFSQSRVFREWFKPSQSLKDFIEKEARSWEESDDFPRQPVCQFRIAASPEWMEWINEYANFCGFSNPVTVRLMLREGAERRGLRPPPKR